MSKKEMLMEYEREQLNRLDTLNLVRVVQHEQFTGMVSKRVFNRKTGETEEVMVKVPNPRRVSGGNYRIVGETCVQLYTKDDWDRALGLRKSGKMIESVPVGIGYALCSDKDQFDRRIGRLKATDRAIKSFLNSEVENVKKD